MRRRRACSLTHHSEQPSARATSVGVSSRTRASAEAGFRPALLRVMIGALLSARAGRGKALARLLASGAPGPLWGVVFLGVFWSAPHRIPGGVIATGAGTFEAVWGEQVGGSAAVAEAGRRLLPTGAGPFGAVGVALGLAGLAVSSTHLGCPFASGRVGRGGVVGVLGSPGLAFR